SELLRVARSLCSIPTRRQRRRQAARRERLMHGLEHLERRTLLASTLAVAANGKSATYMDVDGDKVTVAVSAGTLTPGNFSTTTSGVGDLLKVLDLSGGGFDGANITVN